MKTLFLLFCLAMLTGCETTGAIMDILVSDPVAPDPAPVCDASSVGNPDGQGHVCVKYNDGKYRWSGERGKE